MYIFKCFSHYISSMVVADDLVPDWHQVISNHHAEHVYNSLMVVAVSLSIKHVATSAVYFKSVWPHAIGNYSNTTDHFKSSQESVAADGLMPNVNGHQGISSCELISARVLCYWHATRVEHCITHWGHWWRRLQPTSSIITDAKSLDSNLDYFTW